MKNVLILVDMSLLLLGIFMVLKVVMKFLVDYYLCLDLLVSVCSVVDMWVILSWFVKDF